VDAVVGGDDNDDDAADVADSSSLPQPLSMIRCCEISVATSAIPSVMN
jgi:hypothetical protein